MKNENLPHILAVQGLDSKFRPIHIAPPLDTGGLSHSRVRVLLHLPFSGIQRLKGPHSPHPPFTPTRYTRLYFKFYLLFWCFLKNELLGFLVTFFSARPKMGVIHCSVRFILTYSELPPRTIIPCPFKCSTVLII